MAAFHGKIMEKYGKNIRKSRQNKEIHYKWKFIAGNIIYFYGPFPMAILVITRG
jgi:hypothetical protein